MSTIKSFVFIFTLIHWQTEFRSTFGPLLTLVINAVVQQWIVFATIYQNINILIYKCKCKTSRDGYSVRDFYCMRQNVKLSATVFVTHDAFYQLNCKVLNFSKRNNLTLQYKVFHKRAVPQYSRATFHLFAL